MICRSRIARQAIEPRVGAMGNSRRVSRLHSAATVAAEVHDRNGPVRHRIRTSPRPGVAQFRACDDQIEHRLRIARRGRHRLQHVDGGGLMLDPLAVFAVALGNSAVRTASSSASVAFSDSAASSLCCNVRYALRISCRVGLWRGHAFPPVASVFLTRPARPAPRHTAHRPTGSPP